MIAYISKLVNKRDPNISHANCVTSQRQSSTNAETAVSSLLPTMHRNITGPIVTSESLLMYNQRVFTS